MCPPAMLVYSADTVRYLRFYVSLAAYCARCRRSAMARGWEYAAETHRVAGIRAARLWRSEASRLGMAGPH